MVNNIAKVSAGGLLARSVQARNQIQGIQQVRDRSSSIGSIRQRKVTEFRQTENRQEPEVILTRRKSQEYRNRNLPAF